MDGGYLVALGAGLASFLSPCVLPLVPVYISVISGFSLADIEEDRSRTGAVLLSSALFVLGFSLVFIALGATASVVGAFLAQNRALLSRLAGFFIVVMGLFVSGLLPMPWLQGERRFHISPTGFGRAGTVLLGMAFGLGWTPCVGPFLSAVLAYAASGATVGRGVALLSVYSLGLGLPFLLVGLLAGRSLFFFDWYKKYMARVQLVSGVLMVLFGFLILSGLLPQLSRFLYRFWPSL